MATYKVTNADAPIESDYWIDYPIKDPATNLDSVDEEGHILVERHVTRSVNLASYNSILAKMPAVDANTTGLAKLKTYAETNVQALNTALDGANTSITSVTKTATDTATTVSNIQKKIDTIQGIDIDEFKLVTDTNIKTNAAAISTIKADIVTNNANAVHIAGNESISGVKTFNNTTKMNDVSVSGDIYKETTDSYLHFKNGTGNTGAYALLHGADHATYSGRFDITACIDSRTFSKLVGTPNGYLTWNGKHVVRSVNGVNADTSGNVQLGNFGAITGKIEWFAFNTAPDGYLVCNGATVSRTTYADLFAVIGTTFGNGDGVKATSTFGTAVFDGEDSNSIRVTVATNKSDASSFDVTTYFKDSLVETQTVKKATELVNNSYITWNKSVALVAGGGIAFTGGTGSTFNLPDLIDKFAQGSTTVGTVKSAGLPNITGSINLCMYGANSASDAFSFTASSAACFVNGTTGKQVKLYFDASKSKSIYGNSSTVQPPALTLLPCIKY